MGLASIKVRQKAPKCQAVVQTIASLKSSDLLPSSPGNKGESQLRLQAEWNRLDEMKSQKNRLLKKQTQKVLHEALSVLSELGVAYEVDPESQFILLISVPETALAKKQAHPLNRLAYSLYHNMGVKIDGHIIGKPLRIEINPLMLKASNAGALFDETRARLTLARGNIEDTKIDDMVIHELRHGYDFYTQANGVDHAFTATIIDAESLPPIHETYPHSFSADELPAFMKQVATQIRMGARDASLLKDALYFSKIGLQLAQAALRPQVLSLSLQNIQSLRANPQVWIKPRWVETPQNIGIDDSVKKVWQYSLPQSQMQICFFETPLIDSQSGVIKAKTTHAFFKNGDYRLDMQTSIPLNTDEMTEILAAIESKVADLSQRSKTIAKSFTEVSAALEQNDARQALLKAEEGLAAIQLKQLEKDHVSY